MKNLFIVLVIGVPFAGLSQSNSYIVKGELPVTHAHLLLQYNKGNNTHVREETDLVQGKFLFKGTTDVPYKVSLTATYPDAAGKEYDDHLEFFLDTGTTVIHTRDSLKHGFLTGPRVVMEGMEYDKVMAAIQTADDDSFMVEEKKINVAFIRSHPDSRLSLYIFREQTYGYEYAELAPLFAGLSSRMRESIAGKLYAVRLASLKQVALGQTAPDFTHPDSSGKMVRLSSFRGKYVLIDFWASWCGPCRGESPYLVAAYDKYKERGFTIIGISLDKKAYRRQWLQAIQQDKLFWTQLSDLSDTNPVVQLYGVKGIPQNFLLDPQGKIVGHNLRGAMLDKELDKLLQTTVNQSSY